MLKISAVQGYYPCLQQEQCASGHLKSILEILIELNIVLAGITTSLNDSIVNQI